MTNNLEGREKERAGDTNDEVVARVEGRRGRGGVPVEPEDSCGAGRGVEFNVVLERGDRVRAGERGRANGEGGIGVLKKKTHTDRSGRILLPSRITDPKSVGGNEWCPRPTPPPVVVRVCMVFFSSFF